MMAANNIIRKKFLSKNLFNPHPNHPSLGEGAEYTESESRDFAQVLSALKYHPAKIAPRKTICYNGTVLIKLSLAS